MTRRKPEAEAIVLLRTLVETWGEIDNNLLGFIRAVRAARLFLGMPTGKLDDETKR